MNPILKNVLAVIAGIIIGSIVNMGLINLSSIIIPLPPEVDSSNMESIKANMHLYQAKHFIMPFLAHALGTLVGALVATKIAASHKIKFALGIGLLFLSGGVMMVMELPSPMWFNVLDLALAYLPMAYLGWKLGDVN